MSGQNNQPARPTPAGAKATYSIMFYLQRTRRRDGTLKKFMFTKTPGPDAVEVDTDDYAQALAKQKQLNAALPKQYKRKKTDPIIPEGYGHPVTVNIPDELLGLIPKDKNRSAFIRNGLRLRLGLEPNEPE